MTASFVCHCHIPKTGGSALNRRLLFPRFGEDRVQLLYRYVFENASRVPDRHISKFMRVFAAAGHVPFGYVERIYPDALYVAVMREPVARTLSFLNFVLHTPDHKVHERLPDSVTSNAMEDPDAFVRGVLDDPRLAVVQANVQTRLLSGCTRLGPRAMDREDLARARVNLARPELAVGEQERLDAFMDALEARLPKGLIPVRPIQTSPHLEKRLGTRISTDTLGPATIRRIEDANALDMDLYARVTALPAEELAHAA